MSRQEWIFPKFLTVLSPFVPSFRFKKCMTLNITLSWNRCFRGLQTHAELAEFLLVLVALLLLLSQATCFFRNNTKNKGPSWVLSGPVHFRAAILRPRCQQPWLFHKIFKLQMPFNYFLSSTKLQMNITLAYWQIPFRQFQLILKDLHVKFNLWPQQSHRHFEDWLLWDSSCPTFRPAGANG